MEQAGIPAGTKRVLFKTRNSKAWERKETEFRQDYCGVESDAAEWLIARGVKVVGLDHLSVCPFHDLLTTHRLFFNARTIVIEGLNLTGIKPGAVPAHLHAAEHPGRGRRSMPRGAGGLTPTSESKETQLVNDTPIIDMHMHLFPRFGGVAQARHYGRYFDTLAGKEMQGLIPSFVNSDSAPEVALAYMDWCGVQQGLLLQGSLHGPQNAFYIDVLRRWPDRFVAMGHGRPDRRRLSGQGAAALGPMPAAWA